VKLNTSYADYMSTNKPDMVIYTGPIDAYFTELDKLEYRSISFDIQRIKNMNYYQPNSVVNYPSGDVPHTRIVEYKHFLNQPSADTVVVLETTTGDGEPYYPVPTKRNKDLYEQYRKLAELEEERNVFFVGRLANYKYFNMDEAISNSLQFFENVIRRKLHL
jgi:UDP-galactopyranose mutase